MQFSRERERDNLSPDRTETSSHDGHILGLNDERRIFLQLRESENCAVTIHRSGARLEKIGFVFRIAHVCIVYAAEHALTDTAV